MLIVFCNFMKNYYQILEIQAGAPKEVIKAAYRALVKKYHPDNYAGDINVANEKLRELSEAYEVLVDESKRREYDKQLNKSCWQDRPENNDEPQENTEKVKKKSGFFTNLFNGLASAMDEQKKVFDNSYLEGLGMDEWRLARAYKKASGARRAGYGKALKELGILESDGNGGLKPTYLYREYFR